MASQPTHEAADRARRIDQNLKKICRAKFGHALTRDEWKALPIAIRRELDKQARQQAYHRAGLR